jgi:GxxExxY protein
MPNKFHQALPPEVDHIAALILDSALKVHRALGPGLLESVYEVCLCHELSKAGLKFRRQPDLPIIYDGIKLESGLRIDVVVEDQVIVELKAVETIIPLYEAQMLTYLKLTGKRLGLLINFNIPLLKDGIKRIIL